MPKLHPSGRIPRHHDADLARAIRRLRRFGIAALAAVGITLVILIALGARANHVASVERETSRLGREALIHATARQSSIRGFVLTGDTTFLARERRAKVALTATLDTLAAIAERHDDKRAEVRAIRSAVQAWDREITLPANGAATPDRAALAPLVTADVATFRAARTRLLDWIAAEEAHFAERFARMNVVRGAGLLILLAELSVLAWLLAHVAARTGEQASQLDEQQHMLEEQAVELEQQLEESQALAEELEEANDQLRHEVTERRSAQVITQAALEAKASADALLSFVLDTAPIGLALHDLDGRFLRVNRAFAQARGLVPEDYVGRTMTEIAAPNAAIVERHLRKVLSEGRAVTDVELTLTAPRPIGERHWLASFHPLRGADGQVIAIGGVLIEITDRRQLERQLLQSQKMEAVGRLAGGIAHDFNNLLTVILSYVELMLSELGDEHAMAADLGEVRDAARRAAGLTNQLLAFSRQQVLRPRAVSLNDVVGNTERLLTRLIGEDVELVLALAPDAGDVRADPGQLEQVIMNLAVNARDAMPHGGVLRFGTARVRLTDGDETRGGLPPGDYVALSVSDTGNGMSPETQALAFEPFFTTKPVGQGTGLGLSTVYGIIKQSGGDIRIRSIPGRGTTFEILLPSAREVAEASKTGEVKAARGGAETILLVEDDDALRALASRVLRSAGFTVMQASNGEHALEVAGGHAGEIHLVATDVVMPGMRSGELVRRLREVRPSIRVLFMSGYPDDDVTRRGVMQEKAELLQKPFSPQELVARVRKVLDE
jgi:PAS domain S-box-containing protein